MALLFHSDDEDGGEWGRHLKAHLPDLELRFWPDLGAAEEIEFVLMSHPTPGLFGRLPNLKAVFGDGAGIEDLIGNPELPAGVPVTRIVDHNQAREMAEWAIYAVLHFHRKMPAYEDQRRRGAWVSLGRTDSTKTRVGVMGLGVIGRVTAERFALLDFDTAGWSRTAKEIAGVAAFHGADGLDAFLARTDMLVCVLPLTPQTRGIIDAAAIAKLPRGACVINLARGGHVVDDDLLAALDSGHLSGAALDVFVEKPLPPGHPFWTHPKIIWTPHIAGFVDPATAADQIAENIRRARDGRPLLHVVDPARGY